MSEPLVHSLPAEALRHAVTEGVTRKLSSAGSIAVVGKKGSGKAVLAANLRQGEVYVVDNAIALAPGSKARIGDQIASLVDLVLVDLLGEATQVIFVSSKAGEAKLMTDVVEQLPEVIASRRRALTEKNIEALVDVYLGSDPLAAAMPNLERDNAQAQARFLERWPVLTAEQVAERAAHASSNRSATASRWKRDRKIFGVRAGGREVFPAFQFDDSGRPWPAVAKAIAALPESMSGWQTAFWFVGANGWLDGDAPVKRLADQAAIAAAAEQEREAWTG